MSCTITAMNCSFSHVRPNYKKPKVKPTKFGDRTVLLSGTGAIDFFLNLTIFEYIFFLDYFLFYSLKYITIFCNLLLSNLFYFSTKH